MKKWIFTLMITALFAMPALAQLREVPQVVKESFKTKYPHAEQVEYRDQFIRVDVVFEENGEPYKAVFNNQGVWKETQKVISKDSIPTPVKDGFEKSKYASLIPDEVVELQLPDDQTQYRLLVKRSDFDKRFLYFSNTGQLLREAFTL